jgi:hypothetical protein
MDSRIARYVNRSIFVSLPGLFDDGVCRPFTLLGAELEGLWLQSDELTRRLLPGDKQHPAATPAAVFVPFAQIAGVLVATGPAPSQEKHQPETATSDAAAPRQQAKPVEAENWRRRGGETIAEASWQA